MAVISEERIGVSQSLVAQWRKRELHPRYATPRGMGFAIASKVDADHGSDTAAGRSRKVFIVRLDSEPVYWRSKKQNRIETPSFGSEFIAMK